MEVIIEAATTGQSLSRCPLCGADLTTADGQRFVCLACDYEETDLSCEVAA
ncbi:hypothetical protein ACL00X_11160 [Aeromonas diversa]|uniref:hypothetical protein n=1 Tax=Aeromonas diversa TaxID=502790 RepID=UPI00399FC2A8